MAPRVWVLAIVFPLLICAVAAAQPVLVIPGRSVGPVALGMTAAQVQRVVGPPVSRVGDLWTYERPISMRIEFALGLVKTITTWDPNVRTAEGLTMGSPQATVVSQLGSPESIPVAPGVWLYSRTQGLAVYVQGGTAAGFIVLTPVPPVPTAPQTPPPQPAPGSAPDKTPPVRTPSP